MKLIFILFLALIIPELNKTRVITIYTIGDSTMALKKPEVYPETGWCMVLGEFFKPCVKVRNHAMNGRSTKSFISEKRWKTVLDSLKPGDFVFIQFGHNDQKIQDTTRFAEPFGLYSENLRSFIGESKERGAFPVLFTPIVRRKFENGVLKDTHGEYPAAVRQVAIETQTPLIDLQKLTEIWVNSLGDEPSKKMFLWTAPDSYLPQGRKDDTHLSVEGARNIAKLAMLEAKKQRIGFSKYLKNYKLREK